MPTRVLLTTLCLTMMSFQSYAAEANNFEARLAAVQNVPMKREQLLGFCQGSGVLWCEGYLASLMTSLDLPLDSDCIPRTDLAPFIYGQVWSLTEAWLYRQPEGREFRFRDAIISALSEREQCDF